MFNTKNVITIRSRITILFIISCYIAFSVEAKPKQQHVFLDTNGNPIPNDILLSLTTSKTKANNIKDTKSSDSNKKKTKRKSTPELERELLEALLIGKTARATHLIGAGVKVNYKNNKGETPLTVAVDRGWASMVVSLIEHGGKFKNKNSRGLSLLHHSSSKGFVDMSKLLIKNGLSPSTTTTKKKWNSLHIAARYGRWQLVQMYLQLGVDPNKRTSDGKTALEIAQIIKHDGIIKILSQVTTARPIGRAANYNRRENRAHYDAIANEKQRRIWKKRMELRERNKLLQH